MFIVKRVVKTVARLLMWFADACAGSLMHVRKVRLPEGGQKNKSLGVSQRIRRGVGQSREPPEGSLALVMRRRAGNDFGQMCQTMQIERAERLGRQRPRGCSRAFRSERSKISPPNGNQPTHGRRRNAIPRGRRAKGLSRDRAKPRATSSSNFVRPFALVLIAGCVICITQ